MFLSVHYLFIFSRNGSTDLANFSLYWLGDGFKQTIFRIQIFQNPQKSCFYDIFD